jgi:hypothetical protein
MRLLLCY